MRDVNPVHILAGNHGYSSSSYLQDLRRNLYFIYHKKIKRMGLVRFELTIDGSLRTLEEFKENTKSVLQRLLTDRPRRAGLSRPVAHHFIRWSPSPFLTRPQPLCMYYVCISIYFRRIVPKAPYVCDPLLAIVD